MIAKLEDLSAGKHQFEGQFKIDIADVGLSVKTGDTIFYNIVVVVSEMKIEISGAATLELDCVCDRCAKRFYTQHSCAIDENFPISANDFEICLNKIDCEKMLYESLIVNLPLKILCKSNCRGLCSGCGVDQNATKCKCEQETDPRWTKLKELKQMEEEIENNGSS